MEVRNNISVRQISQNALIGQPGEKPIKIGVVSMSSDKVSFSKLTKKAPEKSSISDDLAGLGSKLFNEPVLNHFLSVRKDPKYLPIITKLDEAAVKPGTSIKDLENIAIKSSNETFRNQSPQKNLAVAYKTIMATSIEKKFGDPKFFNGEKDKIFHYFASASLTTEAYNHIPLLPHGVKLAIASNTILAIGWLKEAASIPGNGFSEEDMQANRLGVRSACENLEKM